MTAYVPSRDEQDLTKFALSLQELAAGRSNGVGTFTLSTGAASTTITDANCAAGSVVIPVPTTAAAATEISGGAMYLSATANKSFTFTHVNSATAGRTFAYAIVG
jgi:hypothetical protein